MKLTLPQFVPFILALALSSCGSYYAGSQSGRDSKLTALGYTALPLQKVSGDARFSGNFRVNKEPTHLLLDSGANSTDIDSALGKRAGVKIDPRTKVISKGALGRPVTSFLGLGSLSAGDLTVSPFAFSLAPHSTTNTATSRYHGQMGLDALNRMSALLDLNSGKMWLPSKFARNKKNQALLPLGLISNIAIDALPLESARGIPHLIHQGTYQNQRLSWIIDTGAEVTVLSANAAQRLNIPTKASSARIIDASGDHAPVKIGTLRNTRFGALNVSEFEVAVTPLKVVRQNFRDQSGRPIDGIIGMDFLEKSHALLDSKSKILYLGPAQ